MSGRIAAALLAWSALVVTWVIFFHGGDVDMCLGPLGVTEESCRAANGMPAPTDWDRFMRGWVPVAIVLAAGAATIVGSARWKRQRGGL